MAESLGLFPHPALTHTMEALLQEEHQEYWGPNLPYSSSLQSTGSIPGEVSPEHQRLPPARLPEERLRDFVQEGEQSIKQESSKALHKKTGFILFF